MSVVQAQVGQTADKRRVWIVFSGLMLGMLIASLDQTVVATALPTIVSDLGGLNQLSWESPVTYLPQLLPHRSGASWVISTDVNGSSRRRLSSSSSVLRCAAS